MLTKWAHDIFAFSPDFLLAAKLEDPQESIQPHLHDFVELVCVLQGTGVHVTDLGSRTISEGDVFIIPRGGIHSYSDVCRLVLANILFDPDKLPMPHLDMPPVQYQAFIKPKKEFFSEENPYPCIHFSPETFDMIRRLVLELIRESSANAPGRRFCLMGLLMVILTRLAREYSVQPANVQIEINGICNVISYINAHCAEKIRFSTLLTRFGMSGSSFLRKFKSATGSTPAEYMTMIRIEKAVRLLVNTDKTDAEIAILCGFREESYMSRCFRRKLGQPPGALRRMWRKNPDQLKSIVRNSNGIPGIPDEL